MGRNGLSATSPSSSSTEAWLRSVLAGERGEALRAQLASQHPEQTGEEIEDAVQAACGLFLDGAVEITDAGMSYEWVRTVAHRSLIREWDRRRRERAVDPSGPRLQAVPADDGDPVDRVLESEAEADLAELVREVADGLSERRRLVLALYGAGHSRPEIARRLGRSQRVVKRDLFAIMEATRAAVARLAGGGCERGEALVVRWACGLASPAESSQARLHLSRCRRCEDFHQQLNLWREKAGAMLPVPAGGEVGAGVVDRAVHKTLDGVGALKQNLADGTVHLKQHAGAAYYRATDPTPLAGVRPGAAVAVVVGCVTIGTGTYCVDQGVNPLEGVGIFPPAAEEEPPRANDQTDKAGTPVREPTVEAAPETVAKPVEPPASAAEPAPDPEPEPEPSSPAPVPASGADSLSGLSGDPTPEPAPAPPPAPTTGGGSSGGGGGSSGTDFGGL
jgi:RNA polymerase sigma factor (sigma-70 family)